MNKILIIITLLGAATFTHAQIFDETHARYGVRSVSAYLKPCQVSETPTYDAECIGKVYLEADKELNAVYQRLLTTLTVQAKKDVRLAQRQWVKKRDKLCKVGTGDEETKSCALGETLKQTAVLKAKEKFHQAVATNTFEGNWQSCFHIEERDVDYCVGLDLIQEADKVWGTREEFASYRTYEIEVMGRVDAAKNIAYLTELGEGNGREFMFKLCHGKNIYYLKDESMSCAALAKDKLNGPYERMLDLY